MKIDVIDKEKLIDTINSMPAIMIESATKARWKTRWRQFGVYFECSHCQFGYYERDIINDHYNYCPCCGALMER